MLASSSRNASATLARRASGHRSPGSRSNKITSGTSIVGTCEYQMCSVIAARLATHTSAASSFTTTYVTSRGSPVDGGIVTRRNPVRRVARHLLLPDPARHGDAVGKALHRQRVVVQIRQDHRRDRAIVRDEIAFGVAVVREEHLLLIGELHRAPADVDGGLGLLRSHHDCGVMRRGPRGLRVRGRRFLRPCRCAVLGTPVGAGCLRASTPRTSPPRRAAASPSARACSSSACRRTATSCARAARASPSRFSAASRHSRFRRGPHSATRHRRSSR